jgi:hypothetical protein
MIEQQLAERFRAAVADEPPLAFDPDETVDRAARGQRRRYAVIATAASTATVALAAVAVFGVAGDPNGQVGPAQTDRQSATSDRPVPPSPLGTPMPSGAPDMPRTGKNAPVPPSPPASFPGSAKVIAELKKIGPKLLAHYIPGLAFDFEGTPWLASPQGAPKGVLATYLVSGTKNSYVTLAVIHEKDHLDLAGDPAAAGGYGNLVSDTTNADGSHVRVYRFPGEGASGLTVLHLRTNGVITEASTTAKAMTPTGKATLPVGLDVLTALATDPRLTF